MAYEKCPKCEGTGRIKKEQPVASDIMEIIEEDCDLCEGLGWLYGDATPLIVEKLDIIIEILNKITGGK
jgi:DnaJ-class molecular chaperone